MFGMGFLEIFLVLLVAIIALGPEKLPGAIVETVKFFKKIKGEIGDAKATIDKELDISQMKEDAAQLKESITNIQEMANVDIDEITRIDNTTRTSSVSTEDEPSAAEKTPKKDSKKEKISMSKSENV
jgi:sec-independent protein translocase protein TatB